MAKMIATKALFIAAAPLPSRRLSLGILRPGDVHELGHLNLIERHTIGSELPRIDDLGHYRPNPQHGAVLHDVFGPWLGLGHVVDHLGAGGEELLVDGHRHPPTSGSEASLPVRGYAPRTRELGPRLWVPPRQRAHHAPLMG